MQITERAEGESDDTDITDLQTAEVESGTEDEQWAEACEGSDGGTPNNAVTGAERDISPVVVGIRNEPVRRSQRPKKIVNYKPYF
jgi:hypothetical protein